MNHRTRLAALAASWRAGAPRALLDAASTVLAMTGAAACAWWATAAPAYVVLAAVLAMSLARSHLAAGWRGWLESFAAVPVVGLACAGVGVLLRDAPWPGAAAFVAVVASTPWMRRFGAQARRIARLVVLPFVTLLIVPPLPPVAWPLPHAPAFVAPLATGWLALASVLAAQVLGRVLGWPAAPAAEANEAARPESAGTMRPSAPLRLALQMAVALAAAFAAGHLAFPAHWRWVVLTALLVNSGNRGRLDVVHKSALRVLGAASGTVLAMLVAAHAGGGAAVAGLVLACVFAGLVLRPFGYGWWALCVTLALALLQSMPGSAQPLLLWERLAGIVLGAAIGVTAAWFVLPIPSTDVLRRYVSDALAAMSDALDPASGARDAASLRAALRRVDQLRPAFRAHGLLPRRLLPRHVRTLRPGDWIALLAACEGPVVALVQGGQSPGAVRKAVGAARKAMREPAEIGSALAALRETLEASSR
jgi:hypothetical protein